MNSLTRVITNVSMVTRSYEQKAHGDTDRQTEDWARKDKEIEDRQTY